MNQAQKKAERDLESEGFSFYDTAAPLKMTVFARQNLKSVEYKTILKNGQIEDGNLIKKWEDKRR